MKKKEELSVGGSLIMTVIFAIIFRFGQGGEQHGCRCQLSLVHEFNTRIEKRTGK